MNKVKLFLENFLIYGFGGIISKIIPFAMLPIITRLMPTSTYFGISDMQNTLVSFASALAIFGMYDAMYRLYFEKEDLNFKIEICSTTVFFTFLSSILICGIMIIFKDFIAYIFFGNKSYDFLVCLASLTTLVGATNSIVSAPTRMQNKRKVFLLMNIISPIVSYSISIPLLLLGHYIIALPLAAFFSVFVNEIIFLILNHTWFSIKKINKDYLIPLLKLAIPLVPNFIIYWIFNSSDKLMITNLLGANETGLYAIGSKLGLASQLIYIAFSGGWQYFSFITMKETNQVKNNSNICEYLGIVSYISTVFICLFSLPLYSFLFEEEYVNTFIISPYLFLAPLLQMLFQVLANQFLIVKKTVYNMVILLIGALFNIIANLVLIPILGIEGAAIATLLGYAVSVIICICILTKMKLAEISPKFLISSFLMFFYFIIWRLFLLKNFIRSVIFSLLFITVWLFFYKTQIKLLFSNLFKKN